MSAAGQHPGAVLHRAFERRNLLMAEAMAREAGSLDLSECVSLVSLVAEKAPDRFDAYARRFLVRLASERTLSLAELDIAVTALRALPSPRAADVLRALV